MGRPTNTIENIHHFPAKKQIDPIQYFVPDEANDKFKPFPKGHLQFEEPEGAEWRYTKRDGNFLKRQFDTPKIKEGRGERNVKPTRFHHLKVGKSKAYVWYEHWWVFKCGFCKKDFLGRKDRYVNGEIKNCGCNHYSHQKNRKTTKVGSETYLINKPTPEETVEMFTGNALKREGRVLVTVQDAQAIWSGTVSLDSIVEKKKRLGPKYFEFKDHQEDSRRVNREEKQYFRDLYGRFSKRKTYRS